MELNSGLSFDVFHPSHGVFHYKNISFHNQIMIQNEIRITDLTKKTKTTWSIDRPKIKKKLNHGYDFTTAIDFDPRGMR